MNTESINYRNQRWGQWMAFALTLVIVITLTSLGLAQDVGADDVAKKDETFFDVFRAGGITMYFLLILSVMVLTFTVEGFLKLRKGKLAPIALIALLRDAISAGNYQQAWEICQANPCFLAKVIGEALERVGKGRENFENALVDASVKEGARVKANLNYLSVVGVVAPMFGLFGTVTGMIKAFKVLAESGAAEFGPLSAAISEALVTTAGGLVVGIPAFLLYYVLRTEGNKSLAYADTEANLLVEDIPVDQLFGVQVGPQAAAGGGGYAQPGGAPGGAY